MEHIIAAEVSEVINPMLALNKLMVCKKTLEPGHPVSDTVIAADTTKYRNPLDTKLGLPGQRARFTNEGELQNVKDVEVSKRNNNSAGSKSGLRQKRLQNYRQTNNNINAYPSDDEHASNNITTASQCPTSSADVTDHRQANQFEKSSLTLLIPSKGNGCRVLSPALNKSKVRLSPVRPSPTSPSSGAISLPDYSNRHMSSPRARVPTTVFNREKIPSLSLSLSLCCGTDANKMPLVQQPPLAQARYLPVSPADGSKRIDFRDRRYLQFRHQQQQQQQLQQQFATVASPGLSNDDVFMDCFMASQTSEPAVVSLATTPTTPSDESVAVGNDSFKSPTGAIVGSLFPPDVTNASSPTISLPDIRQKPSSKNSISPMTGVLTPSPSPSGSDDKKNFSFGAGSCDLPNKSESQAGLNGIIQLKNMASHCDPVTQVCPSTLFPKLNGERRGSSSPGSPSTAEHIRRRRAPCYATDLSEPSEDQALSEKTPTLVANTAGSIRKSRNQRPKDISSSSLLRRTKSRAIRIHAQGGAEVSSLKGKRALKTSRNCSTENRATVVVGEKGHMIGLEPYDGSKRTLADSITSPITKILRWQAVWSMATPPDVDSDTC